MPQKNCVLTKTRKHFYFIYLEKRKILTCEENCTDLLQRSQNCFKKAYENQNFVAGK